MKLSDLSKRMIITILIIAFAAVLISVLYYRSMEFLPFLFGVLLGSAFSIFKVFLLENAVDKALAMGTKKAGSYVGIQHFLRLFLTAVVLFLGAVLPQINLWGVVTGVFAFQLAVYNIKFSSKN